MNIIIPACGTGQRFVQENYRTPKPLIRVLGKPMIFWVLDCLQLSKDDTVTIIYNETLKSYHFKDVIRSRHPHVRFHVLQKPTQGAAHTIMEFITSTDLCNSPIAILDCDTFYTVDIVERLRREVANTDGGAVVYFKDNKQEPIYSYIALQNERITDIVEKIKISDNANTGCYFFSSSELFVNVCSSILSARQSQADNGEIYVSHVVKELITTQVWRGLQVVANGFYCLGTPMQVRTFAMHHFKHEKRRMCFDLDNTLVSSPKKPGDYSTVEPYADAINFVRYLKSLGHTIIIYTARRMRTHGGNVGKVISDVGAITLKTINDFEIPCDEFYFGKPYADLYVDDLACDLHDIERETGFYNIGIKERDFNELKDGTLSIYTKTSKSSALKGEIYYYQHIPVSLRKYFPAFIGETEDSYTIEKIKGVTLSYLFVNSALTKDAFGKLLKVIEEIHSTEIPSSESNKVQQSDIYKNYSNKVKERYYKSQQSYHNFPNHSTVFCKICALLGEYSTSDRGKMSVIHGDLVFSNILLEKQGKLKFIDMRGLLGDDIFTILGDRNYDYAKVYQSLCGYDFIMLDKALIRNDLYDYFCDYITERFGQQTLTDIKHITASLFFSLIPLHNDAEKCRKYFDMASSLVT